jgi:anti-anti-sigma regulatory factor
MTTIDTRLDPSAAFTVTGSDVISVVVRGTIDRGAVRGFDAVVDWLVLSPRVVIDLRECETIDGAGRDGLSYSLGRLRRAGTSVSLVTEVSAHDS